MDGSLAVVNLVLLLLFFFMVAGQTMRPGAEVTLAETGALPLDQLPAPILVVRGPDEWLLDGAPVSPALLPAALATGATLHLMLDRDAPAALLVETLSHPVLADYRLRLVTLRGGAEATAVAAP